MNQKWIQSSSKSQTKRYLRSENKDLFVNNFDSFLLTNGEIG